MLNPGDNRTLGCFVKESRLDNDFKLALYPRWQEASWLLASEIARTKELYFKAVTDPRIAERVASSPLELAKLHHGLAEFTDKWTADFARASQEYAAQVELTFRNFAQGIESRGKIEAKIERCFKPYVQEADKNRRAVFEAAQRNLIDGLLWEHTTRDNRKVEEGQPSVCSSTNHETSADNHYHQVPQLSWDDYSEMNFVSSKSAVNERNPERPVTETGEDDQVSSVN